MSNWVPEGTGWRLVPSSSFDRDYTFESAWLLIKVPSKVVRKEGLSCGEPQRLALLIQRTSRERGWSPTVVPYQIYWEEDGDAAVRVWHKDLLRSLQKILDISEFPEHNEESILSPSLPEYDGLPVLLLDP